jgi:iron-sulfur cluster assembly accessory protein
MASNPALVELAGPPPYLEVEEGSLALLLQDTGTIAMTNSSPIAPEPAGAPLVVTDRAARRINAILAREPEGSMLRLSVNGGGCSGFQYDFGFDTIPGSDDLVIEKDGVRVLVDAVSLPFVAGSVLDFVDDLMGQSFRVQNPNAKAACGCGTSFSI